jgi:EAL domain-containing protein (putative c-di-GMP-specific phosphodiesterase class I)
MTADEHLFAGAEALIRWKHPERGLVPPGMFIPLAEQTTLIHPVTEWLIGDVCRQLAEWNDRGSRITVAINLAAANLQNAALPDIIGEKLAQCSIDPCQLVCEITESGFVTQPEAALDTLLRLRELGVTLSLDDFGTGYSSLAYLRDLPIQEIKLDRSFVSKVSQSARDEQIIAHVVQLAHVLELKVVAEGVEDHATAERLATLGCDLLQGFCLEGPTASSSMWQSQRGRAAVIAGPGGTS